MTTERKKLIRRRSLRALYQSQPFLMSESVLLDAINLAIRPEVLVAELREVLGGMEDMALIKRVRDEDNEVVIKLTDEGKAELQ